MEKPELSIIILNYNTEKLLRQCLESVISDWLLVVRNQSPTTNHQSPTTEIIVVDNGSTDKSVEMVKSLPTTNHQPPTTNHQSPVTLRLITNEENLGFAKGNNVGLREAAGKYILFLNSDTVVCPDTFEKMLNYMNENPKVGVATCRVEFPDGNLDPASHRGFPTPWRALTYFSGLEKIFPRVKLFSGYHLGHLDKSVVHEIDTPTGAFYLTRKEILDQVGSFDEKYFMYAEDIDLSLRIKQAGWKIMFVPITKIVHFKKQSGRAKKEEGQVTDEAKKIREKTTGYFFDSMKIFYDTHYQNVYPWIVREMVLSGIWFITQIKILQNKLR